MGMRQITTDTIPDEILDQYIPQEIKNREKLIKNINECYQWDTTCFVAFKRKDYSFITKCLAYHNFHLK